MKNDNPADVKNGLGRSGFSLIELMIVLAILGILGVAAGFYMNTADTKLKTFVFNVKTRFNQARFEAIKRNRDVYIDFDLDRDNSLDNGFTIWADEDASGSYAAANDTIIAEVEFDNRLRAGVTRHGPEIYCGDPCASGGPNDDGPKTKTIGDGVSATNDSFRFQPNGDSKGGAVYFYFPDGLAPDKKVIAGPWAIIVNTVGRIRVDNWQVSSGWVVDE